MTKLFRNIAVGDRFSILFPQGNLVYIKLDGRRAENQYFGIRIFDWDAEVWFLSPLTSEWERLRVQAMSEEGKL